MPNRPTGSGRLRRCDPGRRDSAGAARRGWLPSIRNGDTGFRAESPRRRRSPAATYADQTLRSTGRRSGGSRCAACRRRSRGRHAWASLADAPRHRHRSWLLSPVFPTQRLVNATRRVASRRVLRRAECAGRRAARRPDQGLAATRVTFSGRSYEVSDDSRDTVWTVSRNAIASGGNSDPASLCHSTKQTRAAMAHRL